jgi:hypothetical protein
VEGLLLSAWIGSALFFHAREAVSATNGSANKGRVVMIQKAVVVAVALSLGGTVMGGGTKVLTAAKRAKQDEFYTQRVDIENELRHYRAHFRDKVVLCNCDDPRESEFFKYFVENFEKLGLKRLIATCYKSQDVDLFSQGDCERAICQIYEGDKNGNMVLDDDEVGVRELKGDGDFRSDECVEILKQADILVTNPPFSLFREYIAQLVKYGKKFIIIGNKNAITCSEVFQLLKNNQMWTGVRSFAGGMWFQSSYEGKTEKIVDGKRLVNVPSIWFTNLDHRKRHEELPLYKRYDPKEFPKYDNYDAINVDKTSDIPYDYDGVMGVPITFIDKYNPEQFELIGIGRGELGKAIGITKNTRGRTDLQLTVNGNQTWPFQRILIRRRKAQ